MYDPARPRGANTNSALTTVNSPRARLTALISIVQTHRRARDLLRHAYFMRVVTVNQKADLVQVYCTYSGEGG